MARNPALRTRRLGEYFDEFPPQAELSRLHTGSWINSDFDIWIGDPEGEQGLGLAGPRPGSSWSRRSPRADTTRRRSRRPGGRSTAAEGSDWFWWYGPDFTTDCDFLFDDLFRTHLKNVYSLLDVDPPAYLDVPICLPAAAITYTRPRLALHPATDGGLDTFFRLGRRGRPRPGPAADRDVPGGPDRPDPALRVQ